MSIDLGSDVGRRGRMNEPTHSRGNSSGSSKDARSKGPSLFLVARFLFPGVSTRLFYTRTKFT